MSVAEQLAVQYALNALMIALIKAQILTVEQLRAEFVDAEASLRKAARNEAVSEGVRTISRDAMAILARLHPFVPENKKRGGPPVLRVINGSREFPGPSMTRRPRG